VFSVQADPLKGGFGVGPARGGTIRSGSMTLRRIQILPVKSRSGT
jgi:hypothetical protein